MAQLQWKLLRWTKWKRKYKGPIGCVLAASCTCKWYTLSDHRSTSSHSCCCCRAECLSQGREGLWTANGEVGALYIYRGRLLRKRRRCAGQGLAESCLHLGFISLHKTTFLPFDPPYQQHSFSLLFHRLNKKGLGVGSPIFVWKGLVAATGHLNRLSTLVVADIVHPSLKAHILYKDYISVEHDLAGCCSLHQMGETLEMLGRLCIFLGESESNNDIFLLLVGSERLSFSNSWNSALFEKAEVSSFCHSMDFFIRSLVMNNIIPQLTWYS